MKAYHNKSTIVLGNFKRVKNDRGRKFNRKLYNLPYHKFYTYIQYKAKEKGVPVIFVNEAYTSKTCTVCGSIGLRKGNWFSCNCGYEDNADRNAAFNIGKRGLSYMLKSGATAFAQKSIILNGQAQNQEIAQTCSLH